MPTIDEQIATVSSAIDGAGTLLDDEMTRQTSANLKVDSDISDIQSDADETYNDMQAPAFTEADLLALDAKMDTFESDIDLLENYVAAERLTQADADASITAAVNTLLTEAQTLSALAGSTVSTFQRQDIEAVLAKISATITIDQLRQALYQSSASDQDTNIDGIKATLNNMKALQPLTT